MRGTHTEISSPKLGEVREGEAASRWETVIARFPHPSPPPRLGAGERCSIWPYAVGLLFAGGRASGTARMISRLFLLCFCIGLTSCVSDAEDRPVTLALANAGAEPLRCRLTFGHWVDRDLGVLAPGAATELAMTQAAGDGALYVLRADGERKMMIETIQCAPSGDWMA